MKANAREFCGMHPSPNDDSSPGRFGAASACLNGTATALISEATTVDDSEEISNYSRASETFWLRRHNRMTNKRWSNFTGGIRLQ